MKALLRITLNVERLDIINTEGSIFQSLPRKDDDPWWAVVSRSVDENNNHAEGGRLGAGRRETTDDLSTAIDPNLRPQAGILSPA